MKKTEIMPSVATWMDPEIVILTEVNQRKKNIIYMRNVLKKMIQMSLFTKQRVTELENKLRLPKERHGGINQEAGNSIYTLLCIK